MRGLGCPGLSPPVGIVIGFGRLGGGKGFEETGFGIFSCLIVEVAFLMTGGA